MILNGRSSSVVPASSRNSRYDVNTMDLERISAIDVSLKMEREEQRDAKSIADGLETWNPPAPGIGLNSIFRGQSTSLLNTKSL